MTITTFTKAVRAKAFAKFAIIGATGTGKTYGSLRLARGLVGEKGRIAFIDTENGSATLYDNLTDFDHCEIRPNNDGHFQFRDFIDSVKAAEKQGYDCAIIDSASHLWQGILDYKTDLDGRGGNSFKNWADAGKKLNAAIQEFLQSKLHVISCMRSKMDYVLETDDKGKTIPKKVGLAPVMRDGIEYEFTTIFDVGNDHKATAMKDRTGLFVDTGFFQITEETGRKIADWLAGGVDVPEKKFVSTKSGIDKEGIYKRVIASVKDGTLIEDEVRNTVKSFGKDRMLELDDETFMTVAKLLGTM